MGNMTRKTKRFVKCKNCLSKYSSCHHLRLRIKLLTPCISGARGKKDFEVLTSDFSLIFGSGVTIKTQFEALSNIAIQALQMEKVHIYSIYKFSLH